jgi:hypothetical protein
MAFSIRFRASRSKAAPTASTADVKNIQAPFRSGIDIEDYQLDSVVPVIQALRVGPLLRICQW